MIYTVTFENGYLIITAIEKETGRKIDAKKVSVNKNEKLTLN